MKNLLLISILFLSLNIFSQTSEEWYEKGDAKVEQNDYKGAISDYTKSIELDSNNSLVYANRGRAKYALQDYRGATADYTKAIEL
jgi:tetratricopeptide (TPR) repeat protein